VWGRRTYPRPHARAQAKIPPHDHPGSSFTGLGFPLNRTAVKKKQQRLLVTHGQYLRKAGNHDIDSRTSNISYNPVKKNEP
jgi:hypothetical protein